MTPLTPLREMAAKWRERASNCGQAAIFADDAATKARAKSAEKHLNECAAELDAFCDAAEAVINAAVDAGAARWEKSLCHERGCHWTDYIKAEVRRALIGERKP